MSEAEQKNQLIRSLADSYQKVIQRVSAAAGRSGRSAEDVMVVAVTQNACLEQIKQLALLGHKDMGETQAPQLISRMDELNEEIQNPDSATALPSDNSIYQQLRWHMAGPLSRDKVSPLISKAALIHNVSSLKIAEQLHNAASKTGDVVDILLQVNASGKLIKHSLPLPAVLHVAEQVNTMFNLRLRGLMATAPKEASLEETQFIFARTRELFAELNTKRFAGEKCNLLSMGTSSNFETAIEQGANVVCIGNAIFGAKPQQ